MSKYSKKKPLVESVTEWSMAITAVSVLGLMGWMFIRVLLAQIY